MGTVHAVSKQHAQPFVAASEVTAPQGVRIRSDLAPWDHVLGGGAWLPSTLLLAGLPGAGKSSRALVLGAALAARTGRPFLYVSAEMPAAMLRALAERLGVPLASLLIGDGTALEPTLSGVLEHAARTPVACVVFDSLPMLRVDGEASALRTQLAALKQIVTTTRAARCFSIVIQHVTKEGEIAGAEALQHEVDIVAVLDHAHVRTLKNRCGLAPRSAELAPLSSTEA